MLKNIKNYKRFYKWVIYGLKCKESQVLPTKRRREQTCRQMCQQIKNTLPQCRVLNTKFPDIIDHSVWKTTFAFFNRNDI